jgi:hypothetical protein
METGEWDFAGRTRGTWVATRFLTEETGAQSSGAGVEDRGQHGPAAYA